MQSIPRSRQTAAIALPLAIFAALVCVRMPEILIKGRFWAEEGDVFFRNAWDMPPAHALFNSFGGYLNLVANASALLARFVAPLPLAPYVTIFIGLAFQLFPPLLILTARDAWLQPRHVRLAAVLLVLLVPASDEIWLQTLHCQFQLTLCCAIVLALDAERGRIAHLRHALLFLAPLCGPTAIALLPLFILRAIIDKSRGRAVQTAVLALGATIQLTLFFHAVPGRGYKLDPVVMLCVMTVRHIELPFLGMGHTDIVAGLIRARLAAGFIPKRATFLPIIVFGAIGLAALRNRQARSSVWLLLAGGLVAGASYFGALGGAAKLMDTGTGERYSFVPQALFNLAILSLAGNTQGWTARASWLAVVWLIIMGGWEYAHPWQIVSDGPAWRKEVALWRADPKHAIQIWPPGWSVTLDPHLR